VVESVEELYNEKIYLDRLFPRFWKLSIKFIERFIDTIYTKSKSLVEDPMVASLHAEHLMDQQPMSSQASESNFGIQEDKTATNKHESFIIDLDNLYNSLPSLQEKLHAKTNHKTSLFTSIQRNIEVKRSEMIASLEKNLVKITLNHLQRSKEVPRQYRRTNRDVPNTPSSYIIATCDLFTQIYNNNEEKSCLAKEVKMRLAIFVARETSPKFLEIVGEVLNNVKKMEESLLKLQKMRKKTQTTVQKSGVSDDDKIRTQLRLDVDHFVDTFVSCGVKLETTTELQNLKNISESIQEKLEQNEV